jgi:hypothetical protein
MGGRGVWSDRELKKAMRIEMQLRRDLCRIGFGPTSVWFLEKEDGARLDEGWVPLEE